MKIVIQADSISKDTLSYSYIKKVVDLLEQSKLLEDEQVAFRKKYSIPQFGLPLNTTEDFDLVGEEYEKIFNKDANFMQHIHELLKKLHLPAYWDMSILGLFICNDFFPPSGKDFEVISPSIIGIVSDPFDENSWALDKESYLRFLKKMTEEGTTMIILRKRMTKSELLRHINKHWSKIELYTQTLPKVRLHRMSRLLLAQEIRELREQEGMSFGKIATHLASKYEKDLSIYDLLTEEYVKNLYFRLKKL